MKKWLFVIGLCAWSQINLAETCPSVNAIKHNAIKGWKAYDSEDGKLLSTARTAHFKKTIEEFALAEWGNINNQRSAVHCYYRDRTGSNLEAYLAKDHFIPKKTGQNYWYHVSGYMHCAADSKECEFESQLLNKPQLAKS